jgi:hypothetical protein
LFGGLGIMEKKRTTDKNRDTLYLYSFNHATVVKYLRLYGYTDPFYENFDVELLKRFDVKAKVNMFY